MKHHSFGKIIAEDFADSSCPSKIIYRSDIRSYVSTQVQAQIFQNANKNNIKNVMYHFNLMAKDWNKIKEMIKYSIKKNNKKIKMKNCVHKLHNIGQKIGGDFWNSDQTPKVIPRAAVRAFIYECVYVNSKICNVSRKNIHMVIDQFNMQVKDRNKVKQMISVIINRNNANLPPILYEAQEDDDRRVNGDHSKYMDSQCKNLEPREKGERIQINYSASKPNEFSSFISKRKRAMSF